MEVLEATGIKKHFGGVVALQDANLKCRQGKITGLLGANGSGKSTLSKIICGVYSADSGEIKYNGRVVKYKNPYEAKKDGIAMVFQNLSLVGDLTVWQNIVLGSETNHGIFLDNKEARKISREIVDELYPGLDIEKKVRELNPGELQIVEISKALAEGSKLLILDEPTAALEQAQVKSLFEAMRQLAQKDVAMIFTSHRIWEVVEICDDIVVFRNGKNVGSLDFSVDEKDQSKIVSMITGEAQAVINKKSARNNIGKKGEEIVLAVSNLCYEDVLQNISFDLKRGEILGIGGLAGQGQRELMLALAGTFSNIQGSTSLKDEDVKLTKPSHAIRNSILLVPGDRQVEGLFLKHSVYSNMIFPRLGLAKQPFFTPDKHYRKECKGIIDRLSIVTPTIDTVVGNLSGGNQQKVVVGKWLSFDTNVLLLADPAKGVDVGSKRDLYDFILSMVRDKKMSVILYASDYEELIDYCDRLMIMYEGKIVAVLEGDDINEDTIIAKSMNVE
jgi:ribose transport system ATP-binding protein